MERQTSLVLQQLFMYPGLCENREDAVHLVVIVVILPYFTRLSSFRFYFLIFYDLYIFFFCVKEFCLF